MRDATLMFLVHILVHNVSSPKKMRKENLVKMNEEGNPIHCCRQTHEASP